MIQRSTILSTAAAALLLSAPVLFAHNEAKAAAGSGCKHEQGATASLEKAMTLLDQAMATQDAAQRGDKVAQARKQLAETKGHMGACKEMCAKNGCTHEGAHSHQAAAGQETHGHSGVHAAATATATKIERVTDPVCGMKIDPKTAAAKSTYQGQTYHFCSKDEKAKFDANPAAYVKKK